MLQVAGTTIDLGAAAAVLPWVLAIVGPAVAWGAMRQQVKGNRELTEARLTALDKKLDAVHADLKSDLGGLRTVVDLYREERDDVRERLATIAATHNAIHADRKV